MEGKRKRMEGKRKEAKDQRDTNEQEMNFFQKVASIPESQDTSKKDRSILSEESRSNRRNETEVKSELREENIYKSSLQSIKPFISKLIRSSNETVKPPKEKSGFNPVAGTQRLISSVWESTIGSRDEWIVALPKRNIDPGVVVPVNVAGIDMLVIASRDGEKIYCIANSCSHLGTPLETGSFERRKTDRPIDSADGCENCIVCPLHQTAFSVETGEVNGPWCPYPPFIGSIMGAVKQKSPIATFDIRIRGKNIEVKMNSLVTFQDSSESKN